MLSFAIVAEAENKKVNKNTAMCEGGIDKYGERRVGVVRADEVGMLNIKPLTAGSRKEKGVFSRGRASLEPSVPPITSMLREKERAVQKGEEEMEGGDEGTQPGKDTHRDAVCERKYHHPSNAKVTTGFLMGKMCSFQMRGR